MNSALPRGFASSSSHAVMTELLTILLRIAGLGLIVLSVAHIPIGRHLKWSEEATRPRR
jgi:hypothetical protein